MFAEEFRWIRAGDEASTHWVHAESIPPVATTDVTSHTQYDINLQLLWHEPFGLPYQTVNTIIWVGGAHPQNPES